ncbi:hypothetical protein A2U01_0042536, partial [Trifolium medium]|nr:hypothetical protein [Trifolium medium]
VILRRLGAALVTPTWFNTALSLPGATLSCPGVALIPTCHVSHAHVPLCSAQAQNLRF